MASHTLSSDDHATFWEERYAHRPVWSGNPNKVLVDVISGMLPGRALELGAGEGADALWLASQGWEVTGVDISATAVERARSHAADLAKGAGTTRFVAADVGNWLRDARVTGPNELDLVTANFFQSPLMSRQERVEMLRAAGELLRVGGYLFAVSHFAAPPWAAGLKKSHHGRPPAEMPTPWGEVLDLAVPAGCWSEEIAEVRKRPVVGPQGQRAELEDTVVLLRRRG